MYIIACIKDRVVYSSENFITPYLTIAQDKLDRMKDKGDTVSKIYKITDLEEVK